MRLFASVFFFLLAVLCTGQRGFLPGYIVLSKGDTLIGEINYRNDLMMAKECVFRASEGSKQTYLAPMLMSYAFTNGRKFVSQKILQENIFLELLVDGHVDIFSLKTAEKKAQYFISKDESKITRIPNKSGFINDPFSSGEVQYGMHVGVLDFFMSDAVEMHPKIRAIKKPSHGNLMKLAEDYHNIVANGEPFIKHYSNLKRLILNTELVGGTVKFKNHTLSNTFSEDEFYAQFGALLSINIPRTNENIYLRTGALYSRPQTSDGVKSYIDFPLQIAYISSEKYRVRPQLSIDLLSPTYTAGAYIRVFDNIHIGSMLWLDYYRNPSAPWIPTTLYSYSLLFNVQYKLI